MRKTAVIMGIFLGMVALTSTQSFAQNTVTKTFVASATIPSATSVAMDAFVVINNAAPQAVSGTALSFDPMTFNTTNKIYLPNRYYFIQIAPSGGAGTPSVNVTYSEGVKPSAQTGHGLGFKTSATFVKVVGATETVIPAHGKKLCINLGDTVSPSEVSGGFLKIYLGVVTGDPNAVPPEPAGFEVFSNADAPGRYDGSVVLSTTLP